MSGVARPIARPGPLGWPGWRMALPLAALLIAALGVRALVPPVEPRTPAVRLETGVPAAFGTWRMDDEAPPQISATAAVGETGLDSPYSDQLGRNYRNAAGQTVMLTLAYGEEQGAYTRVHPPEACYVAAGFDIRNAGPQRLSALERDPARPLMARRMLAQRAHRHEVVSYWIRIGPLYTPGNFTARWHMAQARLQGHVPDGILVRASMLVDTPAEAPQAHAVLETFLADLVASSSPEVRRLMLGA